MPREKEAFNVEAVKRKTTLEMLIQRNNALKPGHLHPCSEDIQEPDRHFIYMIFD